MNPHGYFYARQCGTGLMLAISLLAQGAQAQTAPLPAWNSNYWGASLGFATNGTDRVALAPLGVTPGNLVLAGTDYALQAGFLRQNATLVWGLEADLHLGQIDSKITDGTYTATSTINRSASLRLRAGLPVQDGLLYLTGGVMLAALDYSVSGGGVAIADNSTRAGFVVGAGYEWALRQGWSVRGEYQYANFGRETLSDGVNSTEATPDFHALRLGFNHRF